MQIRKKLVGSTPAVYRYEIGCVVPKIGGDDFEPVFTFDDATRAAEMLCFLNGGPRGNLTWEQIKGAAR